jgi:hypothetical protein
VDQGRRLFGDRARETGMTMAERADGQAAEKVEVRLAVLVDQPRPETKATG